MILDALTALFAFSYLVTTPYLMNNEDLWQGYEKSRHIRFFNIILSIYAAVYLLQYVIPALTMDTPIFRLFLFGGIGGKQLVLVYIVRKKKPQLVNEATE